MRELCLLIRVDKSKKGLYLEDIDVGNIVPGTLIYSGDYDHIIMKITGIDIQESSNIRIISESEYDNYSKEFKPRRKRND